jgi:hypothetical protein
MAESIGLAGPAAKILAGKCHLLFIGDSQSIGQFPRQWTMWPRYCPVRYHYVVLDPRNTSAQVMSNNLGFGGTNTDAGNLRTDTAYGALTTGPNGIMRPARCSSLTSNTADGSVLGSGMQLNRKSQSGADVSVAANLGYPWPDLAENAVSGVARPWYHNTHIKCKGLFYNCVSPLTSFDHSFNRAGKSATDVVTANAATPLVGTTIFETTWTNTRADDNDYDTATSTGIFNDHDIQYRLYARAGVNETGLNLVPVGCIVARCDSGGTIPWNADGTGASYDHFGISGSRVSDWLNNYATQDHWQEYFTRTVLNPAGVTVMGIMLGHNVESGVDTTGDVCNDVWREGYEDFVNMLEAAYAAAFPTGSFTPLIIVPWRSGESSAFQSVALARSIQAQVERMCNENGWPMFSFFEYFNQVAPFHMLHASSIDDSHKLLAGMRDAMDRATGYQYAFGGAVGGGSSRSLRRSR